MLIAASRPRGYKELSRLLRESIEGGERQPGEKLPTESEMSSWFGMNRHTVRAALQELERDGYICRMRGKGTFVSQRRILYSIAPGTSFSASIEKLGLEGSMKVLKSCVSPAGERVGALLGLKPGDEVVAVELLRSIDGAPVCVSSSFLPRARFGALAETIWTARSLYKDLRAKYGVAGMRRAWSEIEASMPEPYDQELLQMPALMPVLVTRSLSKDSDGRPVEYCESRNRGDVYTLKVNLERMDFEL